MRLQIHDFKLRPETTLGQIWETVRQWILNSPYSKFRKVPRKLPTKISEGEFVWDADGDNVALARVGEGMEVASTRVRKGLKWRTNMNFSRQKKAVKCSVSVMLDGTIPEEVPLELKVPRIVKQLQKIYGFEKAEKKHGKDDIMHDIQKTVHRIEELNKNRAEQEKKKEERRSGEDKCYEYWNKYLDGELGEFVQSGKKSSFEDLFSKPRVKSELAKYHITTKKQIADAVRNARNRVNSKK